jgi:hypothetical protein
MKLLKKIGARLNNIWLAIIGEISANAHQSNSGGYDDTPHSI